MHTQTLKKWALALTFWLAVHRLSLQAQTLPLGPYGTSPTTFEVDANGLLFDTGTLGTGTLSLSGAGTRMFFYPGKSAFRAGTIESYHSTAWDDANIGLNSIALGYNVTASGGCATAFGIGTTASGYGATAMGDNTTASGYYATAFGKWTTASGGYATTFGVWATASGYSSAAFGVATTASGDYSASFGLLSSASAYASFVIGRYNVGLSSAVPPAAPSATAWVATDPLFEIGNGTSSSATSDALVVYKNGNAALQGSLTVAPSGDIPMYTGN